MQVMTSYFYQIRNFKPYMIPLSTAIWDPKWFHQNKGQNYRWKDKNGVWNGLRAEPFQPGPACENLCRGLEYCKTKNPNTCAFLKEYYHQLNNLNFEDIYKRILQTGEKVQNIEGFSEEPIIVFIVHEAYENPCSERWIIKRYFEEHGISCKEFNKE